jgi:hypothetical protein
METNAWIIIQLSAFQLVNRIEFEQAQQADFFRLTSTALSQVWKKIGTT